MHLGIHAPDKVVILRRPKVCSCGLVHAMVRRPIICGAGHTWFNCQCGSTLVEHSERFEKVKAIVEKAVELADGDNYANEVSHAMRDLGYDAFGEDIGLYEEAVAAYGHRLERELFGSKR